MTYTAKIVLDDKTLSVPVQSGDKLIDILIKAGALVHAPCGGRGVCGKCLVKVEGAFDSEENTPEGYALSCRSYIKGDITIYVTSENAEILADFNKKSTVTDGEVGLGVAVDIGTTTLAAFLMDLHSGEVLASETMLNPQRAHGADVVSRIAFSIENTENKNLLKTEIETAILSISASLLKKAGCDGEAVKKYSFVGNTAMMHFLSGYSAHGISAAPFTPSYTESFTREFHNSSAYFGGCISGYVGADTLACMVAGDFHKTDKTILLIDIGTNGEIALVHKGNILTCSCAAGPAFEGAHIACGTGAVKGAIDHAKITDGKLVFSTIHNAPAVGICGSGLIDLVACLVEKDEISPMGRMAEDYKISENVYLSKKDIREVQLAKAAIAAGIDILIQETGITDDDIDEVLIAGGFGNFIDLKNACAIGLLPKSLLSKIRPVGNAAGEGASMALVSAKARADMSLIQSKSTYIELAAHRDFADFYADHLPFEALE
ncbi:MAG: DUF4445 domain-containing protein [Clostridia bacterium]|nr:DUF4445 domain-containing protein [Clostridia bacterium]